MNVMDYTARIYVLTLLFIVGWAKDSELNYCMNLQSCGYTVPPGDIILEYGKPLNITCNLYPKYLNDGENASSVLYFKRGNKVLVPNNYDILDEKAERVQILNSTSIRLIITKPEKMKYEYFYCWCRNKEKPDKQACSNVVLVGIPPQNITDFSCKSHNWESMSCSWTPPENYVVTTYKVSFMYPDYYSSPPIRFEVPQVPKNDESHNTMNFTLVETVLPFYRHSQKIYVFNIQMSNTFGTTENTFVWYHFKNVYLNPPPGLTGISTSPNDISLRWNLTTPLPAFPEKLLFRIMYKCEKFCHSWKLGRLLEHKPKPDEKILYYKLTNLTYAHELYDIRVSVKVANASNETWSDNSTVIVKTESKIPGYPPPTTLGSFQFVNSQPRQVYVYFQQIKPQDENGEDFKYVVESDPPLKMTDITYAYAKFEGLEEKKRYTMRIWSENQIGKSKHSSTVVIPSQRGKEPHILWKIVHTNVKYELEWQPRDTDQITNYTLFWCEHPHDRPYQCMGFLNWTIVPSHVVKYNVTVEPSNYIYQFAIAANTISGSSGMLWASCTILANGTVLKINELLVKNVGPHFIELNWRQDCTDLNSEVTGYVIYYCATNNTYSNICSTPMKNITLIGTLRDQSGTVQGLTPYTTYLLAVSVKTNTTVGEKSDFVRNVTSEAAPSTPPLDISVGEITNSSLSIQWKRPNITNGNIKNYNIFYNDKHKEISGDIENYTLRNLESYENYSIVMKACTVSCSNASIEINVKTKMGTPDMPGRPYLNYSTESEVIISWKKPDKPRGDIRYYQILITSDGDNITGEIKKGTNNEMFSFKNCDNGKYSNYVTFIRVRAVNVIGNEDYPGPWSEPYTMSSCYQPPWYIAYIAAGILLVLLLGFGGHKLYLYYINAKNIIPKLPAGLANAVERSEKNLTEIDRYCPDEELLLEKIAEKCPVGDSSGCSSGQESISSSVESSTHLSVDSGTDQPRTVTDEQKENSLRLRNVSAKGYELHDPTPTINRGTKPIPTAAGNYCVLGVDSKPSQDSPYVTISDMESVSSAFKSNDNPTSGQHPYTEFFKTPNPGYVPFANPEPASKNTGYVVAGDLSSPSVEKTDYLLADTSAVGLKPPATVWQQPSMEPSLTKPGYVSVGDSEPPATVGVVKEVSKGYVPHRQFEAKSLKED